MTRQPARGVNVIMPVYRGDDWWPPAIASLRASRSLFDDVVVSFDGPTRHELAAELAKEWTGSDAPKILVTPTAVSWVEHIQWLVDQDPLSLWSPDTLVMLLAEDDLICADSLEAGLNALRSNDGSILFGRWTDIGSFEASLSSIAHDMPPKVRTFSAPNIATRLAEIAGNKDRTSISGIALRMSAFRSYVRIHGSDSRRKVFNGVRAEFLLATQPGVTTLIQCDDPIVHFQVHGAQAGQTIPSRVWVHDEALYQLWLLMTPQPMRLKDRAAASLRFVKRFLQMPSVIQDVRVAVQTFRGVRDAS